MRERGGRDESEDGNGRGLEGRRKERKKGVDTGNRTADSQLLTWVNGLPTAFSPPHRIFSPFLLSLSLNLFDSSNYIDRFENRRKFRKFFFIIRIAKVKISVDGQNVMEASHTFPPRIIGDDSSSREYLSFVPNRGEEMTVV